MTRLARSSQRSVKAVSGRPAPSRLRKLVVPPIAPSDAAPLIEFRPSLSAYLRQRLTAFSDGFRHNVAVLGQAGSGKSTLLQQTLHASDARVTKITCEVQRESVRDFIRRFATAVLRGALDAPAGASFGELMERAASPLPKTAAAVEQLERYANGHLQAEAFAHALDIVPVVHQELGRPCVLVLDEFLRLEDLGLSHAFHELGKRVMTWPFTLFILSSSSVARAQEIIRERLHLLFGQFEVITLGPVETPATLAWMRQELPSPSLPRFLLHWAGMSPWYLAVLLKRLKELTLLKQERSPASSVLAQAAWDTLGSPDGALYQWCAGQVERIVQQRHGPVAREALIHLALGARTTQAVAQHSGTRQNLSLALQMLSEADLIQRKGACWVIPDQVFACWLSAVLAPTFQRGLRDQAALAAIFEQTMHDLWVQWERAMAEPLAARIERLLSAFRNETVSLDHKTGRLLHFRRLVPQPSPRAGEAYLIADGDERRWCCLIAEGRIEEAQVAGFEEFCRSQLPRPSRKVVIARDGLELNATLLAKEASMWVWQPEDVNLLALLYGQPPLA